MTDGAVMASWKQPPPAKVYEALSAVADGRVSVTGPGAATVLSSGRDRTYDVEWSGDGRVITANDNASYWQGYAGYPIIAVLLTIGTLRVDEAVVPHLAGVDWHELNRRYRRDYRAAIDHVLCGLEGRGTDTARIVREVAAVMEQLAELDLERPPRRRRPPKGG
jgi:hypothetical protein